MSKKNEAMFVAKNIFKEKDCDIRKIEFNKCYERYINFCENKT